MVDRIDPITSSQSPSYQVEEAKKVAAVSPEAHVGVGNNAIPVGIDGDRRLTHHHLETPEYMEQSEMLRFGREMEQLAAQVKRAEEGDAADHNRSGLADYRLLVALLKAHANQSEEFGQLSSVEMLDLQERQNSFRSTILKNLKELRHKNHYNNILYWTNGLIRGVVIGNGLVALVSSRRSLSRVVGAASGIASGVLTITQGVVKHDLARTQSDLALIQHLRRENAYMIKERITQIGNALEAVPQTMEELMQVTKDLQQASRMR